MITVDDYRANRRLVSSTANKESTASFVLEATPGPLKERTLHPSVDMLRTSCPVTNKSEHDGNRLFTVLASISKSHAYRDSSAHWSQKRRHGTFAPNVRLRWR